MQRAHDRVPRELPFGELRAAVRTLAVHRVVLALHLTYGEGELIIHAHGERLTGGRTSDTGTVMITVPTAACSPPRNSGKSRPRTATSCARPRPPSGSPCPAAPRSCSAWRGCLRRGRRARCLPRHAATRTR